jgi:hypothetical protein
VAPFYIHLAFWKKSLKALVHNIECVPLTGQSRAVVAAG